MEAPLLCVSGVSGADLKKRIQGIFAHRAVRNLDWPQKALLAVASIGAIAAPIGVGILNAPPSLAQSQPTAPADAPLPQFEVASIKPSAPASAECLSVPAQTAVSPSIICREKT